MKKILSPSPRNRNRSLLVAFIATAMIITALPFLSANDNGAANNVTLGADYDTDDVNKLTAFASHGNNLSELGWVLDGDPGEWGYVSWVEVSGVMRLYEFGVPDDITLGGYLDLSGCSSLVTVYCCNGTLTSLDVSGCTDLTELYCERNLLTSLDVNGCTDLKDLYCSRNLLTELVLDDEASYNNIDLRYNLMGESDVTGQTVTWDDLHFSFYPQINSPCNEYDVNKLKDFASQENNLSELGWDLNGNPMEWSYTTWTWDGISEEARLYEFSVCYANIILRGDLDLSGCTSLECLNFDNYGYGDLGLSSIDVSGCTSLIGLYCSGNSLTSLNVSGCTDLITLYCHYNPLTELDLSGCTDLITLYCHYNPLTELDLSGCTDLITLYCYSNLLTELDVSGCTGLMNLYCQNNLLTELNINGLAAMGYLDCSRNLLTELELNAYAPYYGMNVSYNLMGDEDTVTGQDIGWDNNNFIFYPQYNSPCNEYDVNKLKDFASQENNLSELGWDLNGNPMEWNYTTWIWDGVSEEARLYEFNVCYVYITLGGDLDLSGCTSLECLNFDNYGYGDLGLSSIDVSGCTSLIGLYCSNNSLTELDVSGCTGLNGLYCSSNLLTELDLSGLADLMYLYCNNNLLTELDISGLAAMEYLNCYNNLLTELELNAYAPYQIINVSYNFIENEDAVTGQDIGWDNNNFIFYPQYNSPCNEYDVNKLKDFASQENNLSELGWDLNGNPVEWSYTAWIWDDASKETQLYEFNVSYANIILRGDLDLSGCTSLESLSFDDYGYGDLGLSSIDVSGCTSLMWLYCSNNSLTELNVSGCTGLNGLYCGGNLLTELNVSGCTDLTDLQCYYNILTELDINGLENLEYISCNSNLLTELTLNAYAPYWFIDVSYNYMENEDAVTGQTIIWDGNYFIFYPQNATYDKHDVDKLKAFASQGNNLSELGWDLDGDPGEWDYVYWDEVSGKMRLTEFRVCGAGLALTGDLDLSDCVSLEYIDFDNRSDGDLCLSSINVSGCVSLRWFYCNDNLLTELDISGCTDLINLYCQNNLLTELDISGLANMSILDCSRNSLTELELNAHASYYEINVSFNLIENEDAVTGQTVTWDNCDFIFYPQKNSPYNAHDADKLKAFASQGNNLSELGWDLDGIPFEWNYTDWIWVSGEARLNYFDVCGANITLTGDLDLSGCTSLEYLDVDGSGHGVPGLTSLSVSGCTSLIWLYCSGNSLTSLNVSGCTDLKYLYCYDNSLTGLVLDAGASYDSIDVRYNLMKDESAVTGQTVEWDNYDLIFYPQKDSPYNKHDADKLKAFALQGNNLSELGWDLNANPVNWKYTDWVWVSGEARLYAFDVYYEGLTLRGDLDLSGCTSLDYLDFDNSGEGDLCLSSINVSGCTSLSWFYCNGNLLTQLNVSGCTGLRGLYCYDNLLTELDLSGCTGLEDLDCSGNLLTQLNVSGCTGLRELYCYDNLLTELDVSGLEYMEYLECGNNLLTELVLNADAFYYRIDVSNNFMEDEDAVTEQTIAWDGYDLIFYPQRTLRITIGTVDRTDTEVTVTFTSSSAGTYYYRIDGEKVDSGDLIGNTELTDTMIAGENTLTLTGLTAGAHIIYIEAADGDGNESNLLKILVPAYPGGDDSNGGGDSNGGVSMTVIAVAAVAAVAVIGFAAYFFLLKKP